MYSAWRERFRLPPRPARAGGFEADPAPESLEAAAAISDVLPAAGDATEGIPQGRETTGQHTALTTCSLQHTSQVVRTPMRTPASSSSSTQSPCMITRLMPQLPSLRATIAKNSPQSLSWRDHSSTADRQMSRPLRSTRRTRHTATSSQHPSDTAMVAQDDGNFGRPAAPQAVRIPLSSCRSTRPLFLRLPRSMHFHRSTAVNKRLQV